MKNLSGDNGRIDRPQGTDRSDASEQTRRRS
jgi:hypothetical protein